MNFRAMGASVFVMFVFASASQAIAESVVELQRKAASEYRKEMIDKGGQGSSAGADPVDAAFARALGQILGRWVSGQARTKPETVWVRDVPKCIDEFLVNRDRYTLRGHPLQNQVRMPPNENYAVLAKLDALDEAVWTGCWTAQTFPSMQIFATEDRKYAVVYGVIRAREIDVIIQRNVAQGKFPATVYKSRGFEFTDRVWASPDIMAIEKRGLGR